MFNALTQGRDALVADFPGLTRDRQYGLANVGDRSFRIIDTGGFTTEREGVLALMASQARLAMQEADAVLFLVDGRAGLTPVDEEITELLRRIRKPVFLVVNKVEGIDEALATADFLKLGFPNVASISATRKQGVRSLMERVLATQPLAPSSEENAEDRPRPWVAVIGKPNVGKSTLINRIVGEDRLLASDQPGTTRDSIHVPFSRKDRRYTLIDTAGIRRRGRVTETIEKFSVVKTLQSIDEASVVVLVMDAEQGIADQDANLAGIVLEAGRGLVVAVNKWDTLDTSERDAVKLEVERRFPFLLFVPFQYISALHGSGLTGLLNSVDRVHTKSETKVSTPVATRVLQETVAAYPPPMVHGRRIKLRFAHQGGRNPIRIIIHGTQAEATPESYRRYLTNAYRKALDLIGVPLVIEFKGTANPYVGTRQGSRVTPPI